MRVLITGRGTSGSFQIRGVQLGNAIGATVEPNAGVKLMREHDVIVLVKRPTPKLLEDMRRSGARIVWDVVDAWPQPEGNQRDKAWAVQWLAGELHDIAPHGVICATKQMELDMPLPMKCTIYHHARPEYIGRSNFPMNWAGYEGAEHYLGRYRMEIEKSALAIGYYFHVGLCGSSFALCLRDCAGYAPRHWKSNVKLANAQALGLPALCSPESGYMETSTGGVLWIESPEQLRSAFDALADPEHYAKVCAAVDRPPTLAQCAEQYTAFLQRVVDGR